MYFSKYQVVVNVNNTSYLFNTFNSSLIKLDETGCEEYRKLINDEYDSVAPSTIELLKSQDFILGSKEDDVKRKNEIVDHYRASKYTNSEVVRIDIGVTHRCNFHCFYCFENNHRDNLAYAQKTPASYFDRLSKTLLEYVEELFSKKRQRFRSRGMVENLHWNGISYLI